MGRREWNGCVAATLSVPLSCFVSLTLVACAPLVVAATGLSCRAQVGRLVGFLACQACVAVGPVPARFGEAPKHGCSRHAMHAAPELPPHGPPSLRGNSCHGFLE